MDVSVFTKSRSGQVQPTLGSSKRNVYVRMKTLQHPNKGVVTLFHLYHYFVQRP